MLDSVSYKIINTDHPVQKFTEYYRIFFTQKRRPTDEENERDQEACTFKSRLQHWGGFGCQQNAPCVFVQSPTSLVWNDQLPDKPSTISDVIVLIVLPQV